MREGVNRGGTANGVLNEGCGGGQAVQAVTGAARAWVRGATARYTQDASDLVKTMGFKIGGFSLNGDIGASVSAETAKTRISAAKSGDVIISHINQPTRPAGAGVIEALLELKARGFRFVHLADVAGTARA